MIIRRKRGWELPESRATPEHVFLNRRRFMAGAGGIGLGGLAAAPLLGGLAGRARADDTADPSAGLYPVKRNGLYTLDRPETPEALSTNYNNYYEFNTSKDVVAQAQTLPIRPWTVVVDGLVEKPQQFAIDDLLKQMPLEERLYRHRCVETWSMAVPWSGFPLKALMSLVQPSSGAKYVRFESFMLPDVAEGQQADWYPWPYIEGLTVEEAANDLTFMVTGMYGKPAPKQNGAPLRLATPWKYGFKSIKGIQKISFVAERPVGLWEAIQASEYGFWANVNPEVAHPRWSQAMEKPLGAEEPVPTQLYNGYGEFVAGLYGGLQSEELYK
jgi:methionine sulfoxide reductase catalytic subunit